MEVNGNMTKKQSYSRFELLNLKPIEEEPETYDMQNNTPNTKDDFWQRLEFKRNVATDDDDDDEDEFVLDRNDGLREFQCNSSRLVQHRPSDGSEVKLADNRDVAGELKCPVRQRSSDSFGVTFVDNRDKGSLAGANYVRFVSQSSENRPFRRGERSSFVTADQYTDKIDMLGKTFFRCIHGVPTLNERFSLVRRGYILQSIRPKSYTNENMKNQSVKMLPLNHLLNINRTSPSPQD